MSFIKLNRAFSQPTGKIVEVFDDQILALPNLKSWVSASDNYVLESGGAVSRLMAMHGTNHGFTQEDSSSQPELIKNALNGNNLLRFNGAFMKYDGLIDGTHSRLIVCKHNDVAMSNILSSNEPRTGKNVLYYNGHNEVILEVAGNKAIAPEPSGLSLIIAQYNATNGVIAINVNGDQVVNTTTTASSVNSDLFVGASNGGGGGLSNMDVAEIMIFDGLILDNKTNVEMLNRYASTKYNL